MTHCIDTQFSKTTSQAKPLGLRAKLLQYFKIHAKRRADRANLKQLLKLHPDTLKDIGLTRGDIIWAANLPTAQSAVLELEQVARRGSAT